jgi:hypothetical protein
VDLSRPDDPRDTLWTAGPPLGTAGLLGEP